MLICGVPSDLTLMQLCFNSIRMLAFSCLNLGLVQLQFSRSSSLIWAPGQVFSLPFHQTSQCSKATKKGHQFLGGCPAPLVPPLGSMWSHPVDAQVQALVLDHTPCSFASPPHQRCTHRVWYGQIGHWCQLSSCLQRGHLWRPPCSRWHWCTNYRLGRLREVSLTIHFAQGSHLFSWSSLFWVKSL